MSVLWVSIVTLPCAFKNVFCLRMAVFTLEDEQIIWHLSVWCEFMLYYRRLVHLDGQIIWEKSSFQTAKYETICSPKNLFVPFSHQTICSSGTICLSRWFVRPLVWKRPMTKHCCCGRKESWLNSLVPCVVPLYVAFYYEFEAYNPQLIWSHFCRISSFKKNT